jgi:hypothetical protein
MNNCTQIDLNSINLKLEHFHPHYLDQNGTEDSLLINIIKEIIDELPSYSKIRAGYIWVNEKPEFKSNDILTLNKNEFNLGKVVYSMIKKSEQLCLFLCTAGSGINDWSRKLFAQGDFLKGYLVDLAGSILVDKAVEKLAEIIEVEAATKGLGVTNTYSPGYCEWPVSDQQMLFSFFPDEFCGVKLTESSLMIPEKSISGMIGAGKKVKKVPYTCAMCNMTNCIYSKAKRELSDA